MQRWEYAVVNLVRSYGMNYRVNGEKVGDWKDIPLHEMFMRMGRMGFEFTAYDGENYVFKRPAQNKAQKAPDQAEEIPETE